MDNIQRIQAIEKQNADNTIKLATLQERAKALKEEDEKNLNSLKELNISKDDLQTKIKELETAFTQTIEVIEKELNG